MDPGGLAAGSGGIGGGPSSIWVFWLENYGTLDRLLHQPEDPVGQAYRNFFSQMLRLEDRIRSEVVFRA